MKKAAAILLVILMAAALCGCDDVYDPAENAPVPKYSVCVDFSETVDEEVWDEESGDCIFSQSICAPVVISAGGERAAERINEDLARQNRSFLEGAAALKDSALSLAGDNARPDAAPENPDEEGVFDNEQLPACVSQVSADLSRGDTGALSLCYDVFTYSGGAHGYVSRVTSNYDSKTGEKLTLDGISENPDLLRQLAYGYILNISAGEKYQNDGERIFYEEDITEELSELVNSEQWYFSGEGLVFYANPYALAPYAFGRIDFVVPYAAMEGLLREKFFPAEYEGENGMMLAEAGDNMDRSNVQMLGTVTLDKDMQSVVISAEETVYDVRLTRLNLDPYTAERGNLLWYRSYMTTGEAVELVLSIPDVMPNVMLSYALADGTVIERGIFQSGEDGSILLVELSENGF